MQLTDEQRADLDAIAWIAWGKLQAAVPGKYTDRDREMFFAGFGYGRLDVLRDSPTSAR